MPRIRMCDADREKYGGDEWVEIEMADILDEDTGVVEQIEEQWGMSPAEFIYAARRETVKGIRALIWAARWKQGLRDDPRTFRPKTQQFSGVRFETTAKEAKVAEEREGRPPANRAERRAAEKAPARKATPGKSTAASKRSSTGTGSGSPDS